MANPKISNVIPLIREEGLPGLIRVSRFYFEEYGKKRVFLRTSKPLHMISPEARASQIKDSSNYSTTFSIITPLFNTPKNYLIELLQSLQKQTYSRWEVCLADASDEQHAYVEEICKKWQDMDPRIKYKKFKDNLGISGNTNRCIEMSHGEYLGLLDHDDILHESALYYMAKAINRDKSEILYTDEARFSKKPSDATDFIFKNGFGRDELRSHNYICHFLVIKKSLLAELPEWYRTEYDGSQDHDMVLRLTENTNKITHIPRVLYYWRLHPNSVSMNLDSKSYAVDAALKAIADQLNRQHEIGTVECNLPYRTLYRVSYPVNRKQRILILVHNSSSLSEFNHCKKMLKDKAVRYNTTIMQVIADENSWAQKCNQIIKTENPDFILMWNVKCRPVSENWLDELLMHIQRRNVFGVGSKAVYGDNTICHAGIALDSDGDFIHFLYDAQNDNNQGYEAGLRLVRNVTALWDGCCLIDKNKFDELGGFDEDISGYEMIDLCLRARKKHWDCIWTPFSNVIFYGCSTDRMVKKHNKEIFSRKWSKTINQTDPYYHKRLKELNII